MNIRKIEAQSTRVESGAIQFGDDWPGLFLRGDDAVPLAMELGNLLELPVVKDAILKDPTLRVMLSRTKSFVARIKEDVWVK